MSEAIWTCKIGPADRDLLPSESDAPMRKAVAAAFRDLTGHDDGFIFSGWGGELTEIERSVVEHRPPLPVDEARLSATTDAQVWAQEFVARFGGDEGTMIGWFANAIEAGRSAGLRTAAL